MASNQYDSIANELARSVFKEIKDMVLNQESDYFDVILNYIKNGVKLTKIRFVIQEIQEKKVTFINRDYSVGGGFKWFEENPSEAFIIVVININEDRKKPISELDLSGLYSEISASIRHEFEHFRQYHLQELDRDNHSGLTTLDTPEKARKYFFNKDEINAHLKEALYMMRKNKGTTLIDNFMNMLDMQFAHQKREKGAQITDEGREWIQLCQDIQTEYFAAAAKLFPFLSPEKLGNTTIRQLL